MANITPGRYRHYKGKEYEVIGIARHSESEEELVVYKCLYGDFSLWVRPLNMFSETIELNGKRLPRFQKLDEDVGDTSKGNSKNSDFFLRSRKHRADDCKDAGGRATQDAKAENRSHRAVWVLQEVNEDSSTELTLKSGKKCIFRGARK